MRYLTSAFKEVTFLTYCTFSPLNRTSIQSASKDRSYTFAKHFRRSHLKYPTVTKNDEPFSTINVMYSVVLGKKPTSPFIS